MSLDLKIEELEETETVVVIENKKYTITCPKYENCKGRTYNSGFVKYFCSEDNHIRCPSNNPDVSDHQRTGKKQGENAKDYSAR